MVWFHQRQQFGIEASLEAKSARNAQQQISVPSPMAMRLKLYKSKIQMVPFCYAW